MLTSLFLYLLFGRLALANFDAWTFMSASFYANDIISKLIRPTIPARHSTFAHCNFAVQSMHAAAAASGNAYWRSSLATACSPSDAGQTDVIIDRHDRPKEDFRDTERPPLRPWEKIEW